MIDKSRGVDEKAFKTSRHLKESNRKFLLYLDGHILIMELYI